MIDTAFSSQRDRLLIAGILEAKDMLSLNRGNMTIMSCDSYKALKDDFPLREIIRKTEFG